MVSHHRRNEKQWIAPLVLYSTPPPPSSLFYTSTTHPSSSSSSTSPLDPSSTSSSSLFYTPHEWRISWSRSTIFMNPKDSLWVFFDPHHTPTLDRVHTCCYQWDDQPPQQTLVYFFKYVPPSRMDAPLLIHPGSRFIQLLKHPWLTHKMLFINKEAAALCYEAYQFCPVEDPKSDPAAAPAVVPDDDDDDDDDYTHDDDDPSLAGATTSTSSSHHEEIPEGRTISSRSPSTTSTKASTGNFGPNKSYTMRVDMMDHEERRRIPPWYDDDDDAAAADDDDDDDDDDNDEGW